MKPLILCLGNELLSDDGFGPAVARRCSIDTGLSERADIIFAPIAGFRLLDLVADRAAVLIIDSVQTGSQPVGHVELVSADSFVPGRNLMGSHQVSLPTALELGKKLDMQMPSTVEVLMVEIGDALTLSEEMSPEVAAAVPVAVRLIDTWLDRVTHSVSR